ncbi:MAG: hypothetical protein KA523_07475 [Flavobacterium sp.]|nr:hypothetical protein [Flavobacterium sp.]
MTKKDFFRLLIKIFTLYSVIISTFTLFPQIVLLNQMLDNVLLSLIVIGSILVVVLFSYLIINFTDKIIVFLKLDSGFDDENIVIGNLNNLDIIKFAIIVIGGFMIVDNFPKLLMDILNEFKFKATSNNLQGHEVDYFWFGVRFLNMLFGYFLISNCKSVANFLDKK